jgi:hypothetical protein
VTAWAGLTVLWFFFLKDFMTKANGYSPRPLPGLLNNMIYTVLFLAHLAKGNVSFCHHLASVIGHPSSGNFSHFNLLL